MFTKALIKDKADVNAKKDDGATLSIIVAIYGHLEIARALIKAGADVNAKKDDGWTPLHLGGRMDTRRSREP